MRFVGVLAGVVVCVMGCGERTPKPEPAEVEQSVGDERPPPEAPDELSVTGLRGTLSQEEIRAALEPRIPKFSRCVQKRLGKLEWLSGKVEFQFHIAIDGSVSDVFASSSSMGDRTTELCMLEVAREARFSAPHGGEADFSWPLEVPPDGDVRPPVDLPPEALADVLGAHTSEVMSLCGTGPYVVTAYLDPSGHVVAAGATASDSQSSTELDCVIDAVSSWTFESPGSYAAKVEFELR